MTSPIASQSAKGPISEFPADDLRNSVRLMTTHNEEGKGIFLPTDHGGHHEILVNGHAVANIIYTKSRNSPSIHIKNGTVVSLSISLQAWTRQCTVQCLDYGIVIKDELEITLDNDESRIMRPGDVSVQRATMHKWRNCSKEQSARAVFVLLDCEPFSVNGAEVKEYPGDLAGNIKSTRQLAQGLHQAANTLKLLKESLLASITSSK
ncbi:uncharacterized protein EAF02_000200 [Botrytis sinoallii]|uniref:uncharacterized protein n=1 Tax=Botrytis sinoallii TaxID=1463999 RepID=UPI001900F989|nr:uncharacterized protein EAF02_000200 [Botrytis sinoallii]KAF7892662.1 hypothetical protein EAF02_000200 [Botrytis sinoallii]